MSATSEAVVIGAILMDAAALAKVDLAVDDFTVADYRLIYRTILSLANRGEPIDVVTVSEALGDPRIAGQCAKLVMEVGSTANVAAYAANVKETVRKGRAKAIAQALLTALESDGLEAIDPAIQGLMQLHASRRHYECGLAQALRGALDLIEAASARGSAVAISTGLVDLDECLGGWHDTDLAVIGARPAQGKTALLLNLADRCGVPCGIISTEQPHDQIGLRFFAMESHVPLHDMRSAQLDDLQYHKITKALSKLNGRLIRINDKSAPTLTDVIQQARQWRYAHGIKILFIDYLQRIRYGRGDIPRHEQVAEITMALKELARELDIPVVALAQVNRKVEERGNKRPTMGDLKDSGAIEQEADQVLTLYRDEVYNADSADKGIAEITICKNRHGPVGIIRAAWRGDFLRFDNLIQPIEGRYANDR